ncbi:hypothetical protein HMN09_00730000 [Mycena chlorophos]|uniref:F-box domain-containing protein n=1 Tax=Mycena chlorophos TaxID=658473 RepID=A0A8H6W8P0_MYCCL|nr:hypothetical protein HMN09_00730000 [Mycena chlorophos]
MSSFASLPPELLNRILLNVDSGTLVLLCRTARIFIDPAQYILYAHIRLPTESLDSWCTAVRNHRHLAERAHSLHISLPHSSDPPEEVHDALRACVNLTELRISCDSPPLPNTTWTMFDEDVQDAEACVHDSPWSFSAYGFHLTKFENTYFDPLQLRPFLAQQPHLRILAGSHPFLFDAEHHQVNLPHLIGVGAPLATIPSHLPLQRVQLHLPSGWSTRDYLAPLSPFSRTLTTLDVLSVASHHYSFTALLRSLAVAVPAIQHIAFAEPPPSFIRAESVTIESPTNVILLFPELRTFTLISRTVMRLQSAPDITQVTDSNWHRLPVGHLYKLKYPTELRRAALDTMTTGTSPYLWRVAIGAQWKPDAERLCTVTRTLVGGKAIGEAVVEESSTIDSESLSMFWV